MRSTGGVYGGWSVGSATGNANTAFFQLIPPDNIPIDPNGGVFLYPIGGVPSGLQEPSPSTLLRRAGWFGSPSASIGVTHITDLIYTTGNTANTITLMQPINWTYTTAASNNNTNTLTLAYEPGKYSTNFAYNAGLYTGSVADDNMTSSDYLAFQLADGTWFASKVSAWNTTSLVVTLASTLPAPTGATAGGVLINTPVFFFGQSTDINPITGQAHWSTTTVANTNRQQIINRDFMGGWSALRAGDPVLFYSPNTTGVSSLDYASGSYWKF